MSACSHHLILFFNEDYSKNIPILHRVYGERFARISYIAPDHYARLGRWYRYPGRSYLLANGYDKVFNQLRRLAGRRNRHELAQPFDSAEIARVIGFKYYFQDFFWQARKVLLASDANWFWFVADDLLLNPVIDETTILDFFKVMDDSRSVVCEPYFRSDEWVDWFQGSTEQTIGKLRAVDAYAGDHGTWMFPDDPHIKGANQRRVYGGCADFFGCHRDLLPSVLRAFHRLALRKVFVEIAIPNVLLSFDAKPTVTSAFEWEFDTGRGNAERVRRFLSAPGNTAFYHPVKFGVLEPELVGEIMGLGVSR